jgi:hypothetical protein
MSLFKTLIIGLDSLNFYSKHLISKKSLSASAFVPLSTLVGIVHRLFMIVVIHKFQLFTKKKSNKKRRVIVIVYL